MWRYIISFKSFIKSLQLFRVAGFFFALNTFFVPLYASSYDEQKVSKISQSKEWLNLLRYERSVFKAFWKSSAVSNKEFFFSSKGASHSKSELLANLEAFQKPFKAFKDFNKHPLCRFPARYKFLKKHFKMSIPQNPFEHCSDYKKWSHEGRVESISLMFATGYFGNPASFFGHPLIRFNVRGKPALLSTTLNYGALTGPKANPVLYVLKGLLGGYKASFSDHEFFYHSHNYGERELRDIWEYELNLEAEEVELFVDRSWELLAKEHRYLFLSDNCASRMSQLLEEIMGKTFVFKTGLYSIPIDVFTGLSRAKRSNGKAYVKNVKKLPSRYSQLVLKYNSLAKPLKKLVKKLILKNLDFEASYYTRFSERERIQVLETLMDYYSYQKLKEKNNSHIDSQRKKVIRERYKYEALPAAVHTEENETLAPHKVQNSFHLRLNQVFEGFKENYQEFVVRPALYDELNSSIARPRNSVLIVAETKFRFKEERLSFRSLDLLRVAKANPPQTNLPGESHFSWKMALGWKEQRLKCENCVVPHFTLGAGYSYELFKRFDSFAFLNLGLQENKNDLGTLFYKPELGFFWEPVSYWKLFVAAEVEGFFSSKEKPLFSWKAEQRIGGSQFWDFRMGFYAQKEHLFKVSLGLFL